MSIEVRQVMARSAVAVRRGTRRPELVSALDAYGVRALTVLDEENRPVGVVSEADVRSKEGQTAGELMSSPAFTVTPDVSAREAARLMYCHEVRQLPVVDPADGRFAGVVAQSDVLPVLGTLGEEVRREVVEVIRETTDLDPDSLSITVDQGVVTVRGEADTRISRLVEAARGVDGVLAVDCDLNDLEAVVEAAMWAPSIHNSQPWSFSIADGEICLRSDPDRRLPVSDPHGRQLLISCGAALFNMRTVIRAMGRRPEVGTLPDPDRPGLVATVKVGPEEPVPEEISTLRGEIPRRRTCRGGFADRPVPDDLLDSLVRLAAVENVRLIPVRSGADVRILVALTTAAQESQARDRGFETEMIRWGLRPGSDRRDGVPADAYPRRTSGSRLEFAQRDYSRGQGWGVEDGGPTETGVVVLFTTTGDEAMDWVKTGQALESVLLYASSRGVGAAFHTQLLEYPHLREFVRAEVCSGAYPQLILRLGYPMATDRTFRRPLVEVLA
uniref:Acg family FMN-binding oxidoreductase n=1 Tax=Herbidospora sakaeratensis TaxID=564415 RepID=UPI000AE7324A|nr:CBS domain-containing protein [Herbidospora sakaeratensis]